MNKNQKKLTQPKTLGKGGRRVFALFAVSTLLVGALTTKVCCLPLPTR